MRTVLDIRIALLSTVLLGLLASCTTLPSYARPTALIVDASALNATDLIPYRDLLREDFKAGAPPPQIAPHAERFGAFTCAQMIPSPADGRFSISQDTRSGDFVARLPPVQVRSAMDRGCSWWNTRGPLPPEYVLQHEQIHFAIIEVRARGLEREWQGLRGRGDSPQEASEELQRALDDAYRGAARDVLKRSTKFDEETSAKYDPRGQGRWWEQIRDELARGE